MKWIPDDTGRFGRRPYYEASELDRECEAIVEAHLRRRRGEVLYPILTDDLHVLIEHHGASIDAYADLTEHGADKEGMTRFFPDRAPLVLISEEISTDPKRENRLRTTLAHEFAHVYFHKPLYDRFFRDSAGLGGAAVSGACMNDGILDARKTDWMEWQAGYVSGAILIPGQATRLRLSGLFAARSTGDVPVVGSELGHTLIAVVSTAFAVSTDAARIRLLKLGLLREGGPRAATSA